MARLDFDPKALVSRCVHLGLIRFLDPKENISGRDHAKEMRAAIRVRSINRYGKEWDDMTIEERRKYTQMICQRRLRAERRGEKWDGPQRVQKQRT